MDPARLNIERTILDRSFPGAHRFLDMGTPSARLEIDLGTSSGAQYRLAVVLEHDYPASVPQVFVIRPLVLRGFHGEDLLAASPSHSMHLLKPKGRHLQLCHYKVANWHPNVTLYKVVLKCLLWLEAYENHLQTGRPVTDFLGS